MSLQFSRSLRSLRIDSYRASRVGLILAILVMAALIAWFFLAKVTLYETSSSISFTDDGRLVAVFSPESLKRIRQGQSAILRVNLGTDQPAVTLPALVFDMATDANQVEFLIMSPEMPQNLSKEKLSGQIEVEVEYITPAQLVLRTSGKMMTKSEIPMSPQSFKETQAP